MQLRSGAGMSGPCTAAVKQMSDNLGGMFGYFELRHDFGPFHAFLYSMPPPRGRVSCALLSAYTRRMLIGACNLMLGPNWGLQVLAL